MTIQKIRSSRVNSLAADDFVGERGMLFYNEELGDLRVSNGVLKGGIKLTFKGSNTGVSGNIPDDEGIPNRVLSTDGDNLLYWTSTEEIVENEELAESQSSLSRSLRAAVNEAIETHDISDLTDINNLLSRSPQLAINQNGFLLTATPTSINFVGALTTVIGNSVTVDMQYGIVLDGGGPTSIYGGIKSVNAGHV